MAFTLDEIIQLTIRPVKNIFIGVVILIVATALYFLSPILLRKLIYDKGGNPLPPGPPIRYAFLRKYPELSVDYWAKKYGSLFSIWMGNQLFVFISDPHIARNLLVVNGAMFSSRKRYFLKNQIILRGRAIAGSEYGERW
jgi:Cytochrome P450